MSELLEIARGAVKLAQRAGAQEASAGTHRTREVEVVWRDGRVEKVSEATTRGLSIALYVDGRYSAVSTNDLRPDAVAAFVDESVAMARTLAVDSYRRLPDPKLYEGRAKIDLQIDDAVAHPKVTPEDRRRLAKELEEAARSVEGAAAILSVETSASDSRSESARVTSNGFEGESSSTSFWLSSSVTVKDPDGRRPEGSMSGGARFVADMPKPAEIGRIAAERALSSIGSEKGPSAVLPVLVENRVAGRLIRALVGPLGARALQQKQSFLEGKLGTQIASELLTITDDPHLLRGFGSRLYDGEGIAAKRLPIVEAGVLKTFYVDDYYGRKLKMSPTTGGSSNLVFALGKKGLEALVRDMKDGILITGFLGGNFNSTTGDYSLGIQGFRIENGARTKPLAEMNISGNQKDLWKKLAAVGSDPYPYASVRTPTLLFDGVQLAGA